MLGSTKPSNDRLRRYQFPLPRISRTQLSLYLMPNLQIHKVQRILVELLRHRAFPEILSGHQPKSRRFLHTQHLAASVSCVGKPCRLLLPSRRTIQLRSSDPYVLNIQIWLQHVSSARSLFSHHFELTRTQPPKPVHFLLNLTPSTTLEQALISSLILH